MACIIGDDVWSHGSLPAARAALILLHLLCHPFADSANVRAGSFACLIQARMEAIGLDTSGWSFLPKANWITNVLEAPIVMNHDPIAVVDLWMLVTLSSAPMMVWP